MLREGAILPEGPMSGEKFVLSGMTETSIEEVADYLTIEYDQFHLRLHYIDPDDTGSIFEVSTELMQCLIENSTSRLMLGALLR